MMLDPARLLLVIIAAAVVAGQEPSTSAPDTVQVLGCNGQFVAIIPRFLIDQNPELQGKPICFMPVVGPDGALVPAVNTLAPAPAITPSPPPSPTIRVYPVQEQPSPSPVPSSSAPVMTVSPLAGPSSPVAPPLPLSPTPVIMQSMPSPSPTAVSPAPSPLQIPISSSSPPSPSPLILPPSPQTPAPSPQTRPALTSSELTPSPEALPAGPLAPTAPAPPRPGLAAVPPQMMAAPTNQAEQVHLAFQNASNLQFDVTPPLPVPIPVSATSSPPIPIGPASPEPPIIIEEPTLLPIAPETSSPAQPRPSQTPPTTVQLPPSPPPSTQPPSVTTPPPPASLQTTPPATGRPSPQAPSPPTPPLTPSAPRPESNGTLNQTISQSTVETNATKMAVMSTNTMLPVRDEDEDDDGEEVEDDDEGRRPLSNQTSASNGGRAGLVSVPLPNQPPTENKPRSPFSTQDRPAATNPNAAAPAATAPNKPAVTDKNDKPIGFETSPPPPQQARPSQHQDPPDPNSISYWKVLSAAVALGAVIGIGFCIKKRFRQKDPSQYELPTVADRQRRGSTNSDPDMKTPSRSVMMCGRSISV